MDNGSSTSPSMRAIARRFNALLDVGMVLGFVSGAVAFAVVIVTMINLTSSPVSSAQSVDAALVGVILIVTGAWIVVFGFSAFVLGPPVVRLVCRAPYGQASLASRLVSIEEAVGRIALPAESAVAEPAVSARLDSARGAYSARLRMLAEKADGLDGIGGTDLGRAMVGKLTAEAEKLIADTTATLAAVGDCADMARLLNDRSRETARVIILAKIPA